MRSCVAGHGALHREGHLGDAGLGAALRVPGVGQHHPVGLQLHARVAEAPAERGDAEEVLAERRLAAAQPEAVGAVSAPPLERADDLRVGHRRTVVLDREAADTAVVAAIIRGEFDPAEATHGGALRPRDHQLPWEPWEP